MTYLYVPTSSVEDWRRLLADPEKQWRTGFSARALAYAWESANGFPPEIQALFARSSNPAFHGVELLLAIPEHKVLLPPYGRHPSQNDLFALARDHDGHLIALTVEGKVSESFDKTLAQWNIEKSPGKEKRLTFIKETLALAQELPPAMRYQLLHRTASAVVEAKRFNARTAIMLVHSFNQSDLWLDDYQVFLTMFGIPEASVGNLYFLTETLGIRLWSGWVRGDEKFLRA
jgi:hypothetical protein